MKDFIVSEDNVTVIKPITKSSLVDDLKELWHYKDLFFALAMREIKIRYKQSFLGIFWFILQPIITCLIFTVVFGRFVRIDAGETPYPVFVFSGLLLWQFFSRNLLVGTDSLVANSNFINKVYFPRLGIPFIGLLASTMDFVVAFMFLLVLMLWYQVPITWHILFAPLIVFATLVLSFAGALIFAPLNAIYRDVGLILSYAMQFLMYLSPVIYPVSFVSEPYRWLFDFNPVATLLDAMRWAVIGRELPSTRAFIFLGFAIVVTFLIGRKVFRKLEPTIVDRI